MDREHAGNYDILETDAFLIDSLEVSKVNEAVMEKVLNLLIDIEELYGQICYILTSQNCFLKCINYITEESYRNEFFQFLIQKDAEKL